MQGLPPAFMPVDSVRFTGVPGATWAPLRGLWLSTSPADSVQSGVIVTVPTVSPAAVIVLRAEASSNQFLPASVASTEPARPARMLVSRSCASRRRGAP